ncbi:Ig-like domain-containing protein, partial [Pseudomonadales bacterium]|nr:Ig-like domain-containing protein [Pseudomonadales bacterium]
DLKVADDFKSGDLVSADTFNQIFDTLESINRTVTDADLLGVWKCSSLVWGTSNPGETGWTKKGFAYLMEDAQLNFSASSADASVEAPYSFTTSAPSPFNQWSSGDANVGSASSGTYILHKGMALFYGISFTNVFAYSVDIISDSRVIFRNTRGTNQAGILVCDSAEAVPASPTSPTAANNKTGINLAWTDSSSDERGFKVYRKLSTETEAKVIATQTAATYSDTDLTEGQTAYYQVVAYNDNGESAKSKAVSATLDATPPTVVSTTPENNGTGSRQLRSVIVTFSEKVTIVCPAGDAYEMGFEDPADNCPTSGSPMSFSALIEGSQRAVSLASYGYSSEGTLSLNLTTMGSAERFDANQSDITVTVNKEWVRDANGLQMADDYQFNFNVDDSLDNPSCPPSC